MDNHSIFLHGSEGIKIGTSTDQIQEEEEEQEDQHRRNEEIKNLLTNAFDDLEDEDIESSVNSSSYLDNGRNSVSRHFQNADDYYFNNQQNNAVSSNHLDSNSTENSEIQLPTYTFGTNDINPNYFPTPSSRYSRDESSHNQNFFKDNYAPVENLGESEIEKSESRLEDSANVENHLENQYQPAEQLDVLNAVRIREINKLTVELRELQIEKDEAIRLLERKLALTQVELERLNISKNEAQKDLADATAEISDHRSQILKLKESNENLEKSKKDVAEKLSDAENTILELEHKIKLLEDYDYAESNKRATEKCLQQMQEDSSMQLRNMQTQVDTLSHELNIKNSAYESLEKKYMELCETTKAFRQDHANTTNSSKNNLEADKQAEIEEQYRFKMTLRKYDELTKIYNLFKQKVLSLSDIRRKDIKSLQSTISQKENQISDLKCSLQFLEQVTNCCSNRVKTMEQEYLNIIFSQSANRFNKIRQNFNQLNDVLKECNNIRKQQSELSKKISVSFNNNDESQKLDRRKMSDPSAAILSIQKNEETIDEASKPDQKVICNCKSDSSEEIMQLRMELHEVQKELDRVKELYIDVCATKDRLLIESKNQFNSFKTKYQHTELQEERDAMTQKIKVHISANKEVYNECVKQLKCIASIQEKVYKKKVQTEISTNFNPDEIHQEVKEKSNSQENKLKEMKKKMETKIIEELHYIKSQYEQKYKADQEKYEKILLLLRRELKEKAVQMKMQQEIYSAEKLKICSSVKLREQKLIQLVEAKMSFFQQQISSKNQQIDDLHKKVKEIETGFNEDRTLMEKAMSEWISEIQHVMKKNVELEERLKESEKKTEEMNANFSTEIQTLKTKAVNDFRLFKQKYELTRKAAMNYKEYARKKEEYVIHQCKRIENGYKKALGIIKQKIEALLVLHEKKSYLLFKQPLKSAR